MSTGTTATALSRGVIEDVRAIIDSASRIGCVTHKDADADSLGSALGFALSLRQLGHAVDCIVPEPMPPLLTHLPGYATATTAIPAGLNAVFTFDCATLPRFGDKRHLIESSAIVVNIDHHVSNDHFGSLNLVDAHASATAQVVHGLLESLGAPITADVATNLYAALFTDTGGFRHENTTEAAVRLGADLIASGADPAFIALKSYKSHSISQLQLEGRSMAAMHAELEGRLVWSTVTRAMLADVGAGMHESEGIIDHLQGVDPMRIAVLFKEMPGHVKISVRSRDPYDATEVCTPFGGGGHRRAAGAEIGMDLDAAIDAVLAVARAVLAGTP